MHHSGPSPVTFKNPGQSFGDKNCQNASRGKPCIHNPLSHVKVRPTKTVQTFCFRYKHKCYCYTEAENGTKKNYMYLASILRKSTSGRHRPVSYPDGPMTARYRFT